MQIVKLSLFLLTKSELEYIIIIEKGKPSNGYATMRTILTIVACVRGGYRTFMGNSIIKMITTKIAISSFLPSVQCLLFISIPPFTDSALLPVYVKVGHNRRCKHREEILPYRIAPTRYIIHYNSIIFKIFSNIYD